MRSFLFCLISIWGFFPTFGQQNTKDLPYGVTVIPLVLKQPFFDALDWRPGDEIWLEVGFLVSPRGEAVFVEPAERVMWMGDLPVLMLGATGRALSFEILSRGVGWVTLSDGDSMFTEEPLIIYPRKQRLRFTTDAEQVMKKLAGALPGVDGSYLSQVANFLAGNLATLDVVGTSYSISGFGEVINSAGEWTGSTLPANQNLFETVSGDSGTTTADQSDDSLTLSGTGIVSTSVAGDTVTITGTEVDGDTTNELQNLFQMVAGDSGATTADSQADTLTVAGGGIVSTSISGDTLTVSATEAQNLFQTVSGDSGSTSANTTTDTLTIAGGAGIGTSVSGDTLSIALDNDSLDFAQFNDAMTVDAATTIDMDTHNADLDFDNQTLFIDASANSVGVGTATPSEALHVDAGTLLQTAGNPQLAGSLSGFPDPRGLAVLGNYAYILENVGNDLRVVDLTRPGAPAQVGNVNSGGLPQDIFIAGCHAFVLDSNADDLRIYDLTIPDTPRIVSQFGLGVSPASIFVSGIYAYVVGPVSSDLRIVDVSNPKNPQLVGTLALGATPVAVAVAGHYAYVVDETSNDLKVIDVADPTTPSQVGSLGIGDQPTDVAVSGRYVYVVDAVSDDLKVIDVSNPDTPSQVTSFSIGGAPSGIQVSGRYAFIIDTDSDDLKVVDIANPGSPGLVGSLSVGGSPQDVAIFGRYALVTDATSGDLKVIDISGAEVTALEAHSLKAGQAQIGAELSVQGRLRVADAVNVGKGGLSSYGDVGLNGRFIQTPGELGVLGSVSIGTQVVDIVACGNYAYVIDGKVNGNLFVVDVSVPTMPEVVGSVVGGTFPTEIQVLGRYAYVVDTGGNRIRIFDISDPTTPVQVGNIPAGDEGSGLFVTGKYFYHTAVEDQVLEIWDVTDPSLPSLISATAAGTQPTSVFVSGRFAYVTDNGNDELIVFDVENPALPVQVGSVGLGSFPDDVKVFGRYAYVVERAQVDFYIIDVADPTSPAVVGISDFGFGSTISQTFISGRYAYFPDSNMNEIHVVDISDPANPIQVENYDVGVEPQGIYISGRYAYLLDRGSDTMSVLDLSGAEISALEVGSVKTSNIQVLGDIHTKGNVNVTTGINIGAGGLFSDGNVGIKGVLSLANDIAPTLSPSNGVQLYAQDVSSSSELRIRDEAGNVTTLSPHNFSLIGKPSEPLAWSYYSENQVGKINVDMLRTVRLVESLSGETLVHAEGYGQPGTPSPEPAHPPSFQQRLLDLERQSLEIAGLKRENSELRAQIEEVKLLLQQAFSVSDSAKGAHQSQAEGNEAIQLGWKPE